MQLGGAPLGLRRARPGACAFALLLLLGPAARAAASAALAVWLPIALTAGSAHAASLQ